MRTLCIPKRDLFASIELYVRHEYSREIKHQIDSR